VISFRQQVSILDGHRSMTNVSSGLHFRNLHKLRISLSRRADLLIVVALCRGTW